VLGLPLDILITGANVQDRDGGIDVIRAVRQRFPSLKKIWADSAYAGRCVEEAKELGIDLDVVRRSDEGLVWTGKGEEPPPRGFKIVKRRWIVERTIAWLGRFRRLSKDYEHSTASSLAWHWIAFIRTLARRIGARIKF